MYAYLAAHSESVLSSLNDRRKNLMHFGTCDVVRFLLDVPLENEKPWWGESASFVDPFLDCLANPDMTCYASLLFTSIIQRATGFV